MNVFEKWIMLERRTEDSEHTEFLKKKGSELNV